MDEMASLQDQIDAAGCSGIIDGQGGAMALDALRCPPGDGPMSTISVRWGKTACRDLTKPAAFASPDMICCWTNRPTTWTRRAVAWLQNGILIDYQGLRDPGHPRPLLPRQHHRLGSLELDRGQRGSLRGQLLGLVGTEGQASGGGDRKTAKTKVAKQRALKRKELEWIRSSPRKRVRRNRRRRIRCL